MEKLPKQVYTNEYRQQAVAMIVRDKRSVAEVSRKLTMSQKTLANWVERAKNGDLPGAAADAGSPRRVVTDEQAELSRLRRENAELRMERDILKNVWLRRPGQARYELWWHKVGRMQSMYPASGVWELRLPSLDGISALATS